MWWLVDMEKIQNLKPFQKYKSLIQIGGESEPGLKPN